MNEFSPPPPPPPLSLSQITHGCDPNAWHTSVDGTSLSLLHRAIILQDPSTACFLIKSGADVNSPTRASESSSSAGGLTGAGFSSPLHMACQRGLDSIVQCLVDHHADPNAKVVFCSVNH